MNTNFKVGQRVKVISGANVTPYLLDGKTGVIADIDYAPNIEFIGLHVKFDNGLEAWCHRQKYLGIELNVEILEPTPKWLPIDRDNLPVERVAAIEIKNPNLLFTGTLYVDNDFGISLEITKGATVHGFTHYIVLQDLLNLPIAE